MPDIQTAYRERIRRLSKEGAWIVLGQISAVLGSLAGVRMLTELLNPAAYGELALGLTVAAVINQTVIGPLANGVARFYAPAQERNDLGGYLTAVRRLVSAATVVIVLMVLLTVTGMLAAAPRQWVGITATALIFAALTGYNGVLSGIQNAARQRSIVALHQGMESWLRFLIAACMLVWVGATSTIAMLGYAVAAMLVLVSQYVFFRKTLPQNAVASNHGTNWQKQIWQYSWPFGAWGIFSWAQQASDRWALELFATTQQVGLYAALFQLGYYPMSIATGLSMQFLGPIFYQRAGDASDRQRNQNVSRLSRSLTALTLVLTGAVFLTALLFHAQIFHLLVAKEYASVSYLLPWMLLAGGVFAAGQTISLNLMSQMKTHTMVVAKIATSSLGIVFNIAGAYFLGIRGIVVAIVLHSVLYSAWMTVISNKMAAKPDIQ
ncbi:MAG: lipopolysaccharide biosynthesis protein [Burkholderiales bacterium]